MCIRDSSNIDFDATINAGKTVITINPDSDFSSEQVVYVAIGTTVEDASDNAISASSATFTAEVGWTPTYSSMTFNLYYTTDSDTSMMDGIPPSSRYEIQVFEINNNTNRNYVRTVYDFVGTLSGGLDATVFSTDPPGTLANSSTLSLSSLSSVYYVMRGSYDNTRDQWTMLGGMQVGIAADGNNYSISQAQNYAKFGLNLLKEKE